jgi:hypothetical protein
VRPVRRRQAVHRSEHGPEPELARQAGERREFLPEDLPVGAIPVRRADFGRPGWAEWMCLRAAAYDSPVFAARDRTRRLRFLLLVM